MACSHGDGQRRTLFKVEPVVSGFTVRVSGGGCGATVVQDTVRFTVDCSGFILQLYISPYQGWCRVYSAYVLTKGFFAL